MTRRLALILIGLAVLAGLALYDRDNSTRMVLPGEVSALEARDDNAGPDTWHITVLVADQTLELEPLQIRPDLEIGERICVTRITRAGQPDEYRRANASDSC